MISFSYLYLAKFGKWIGHDLFPLFLALHDATTLCLPPMLRHSIHHCFYRACPSLHSIVTVTRGEVGAVLRKWFTE